MSTITSNHESPSQYEIKLFAYVDVLGWTNLIEKSVGDKHSFQLAVLNHEHLKSMTSALQIQKEFFNEIGQPQHGPSVEVTQFSDTIVFSCPVDKPLYFGMLLNLYSTCAKLLEHGLYTRGALTVGQIYHKDDSVFGPALIQAHSLEQHVAVYPRIVVDETAAMLLKLHEATVKTEPSFRQYSLTRLDTDGVSFLNVLTPPIMQDVLIPSHLATLQHYLGLVDHKCREHANNPRLLMKHKWMRHYVQALITECSVEQAI
jgi:hypothetical protein